jgi:hypothetical protein
MFHSHYSNCRSYDPARMHTKEDWSAVLALAHRWDFAAIRAVAIGELVAITTPVDKLVLARDYDVSKWLAGAYLDVCQASEYPSDEDCLRLDRMTIVKIGRAREALRSPGKLIASPARAKIIRRIFDLQRDSVEVVQHNLMSGDTVETTAAAVPVVANLCEVPTTKPGDETTPEGFLTSATTKLTATVS